MTIQADIESLPTDIDVTYPDRTPGDGLHQRLHDSMGRVLRALIEAGADQEELVGILAALLDGTYALAGLEGLAPTGAVLQPEGTAGSIGMTADRLYFCPVWVPLDLTTASLQFDMTIAGSGGTPTIRLGLYSPDANGRPGSLLVDAGTVDATVAPGIITKALTQAVPRGLVWCAMVPQGATTSQPAVQMVAGRNRWVTLDGLSTTGSQSGYRQQGVAGALPATATPHLTAGTAVPIVAIKAAA